MTIEHPITGTGGRLAGGEQRAEIGGNPDVVDEWPAGFRPIDRIREPTGRITRLSCTGGMREHG